MNSCFILLLLISVSCCFAVPKSEDDKSRSYEKDLSDKEHYKDGEHNVDYDHDAFLGEEAHSFDKLSPEESQRRLGVIFDKIDKDGNGEMTQEELQEWIQFTQKRYISEDVDRQWKAHNAEDNPLIKWEEYKKIVYGFMDQMDPSELAADDSGVSYNDMLKRDRRRWQGADEDGDDALTKEEFAAFLHPEEKPHMRDIIVTETMEDIDKDKDGKVSLKEYIGDMYKGDDESEPEWVGNEREQFKQFRDKNQDGFMDTEEVKSWIIPPDFDHSEAESKHLLFESDVNKDGVLSKEEVLEKYDVFVSSQATDFGEALNRHDEF